ncbi:MAG: glycosyltransferase, partial [Sphingobacteriales bacterium]
EYIGYLRDLATELNLSDKLEWCGWIGGDNKFDFLRSIDVLVLTSYNENFANVVVESLATGTPVLLSEGVGLAEFVNTHHLGWVCQLQVESIFNSLHQIFQQRDTLYRIRESAPGIALRHFDKQRVAAQYVEAYETYCQPRMERERSYVD